ncbi:transmembrane protein 144-like isoform X1 [Chiloscyllium plagiosum]|uniref:transmembrane protein 144-like isoform X1 n=2 Tax=Chiloscyllium plagiosum TaxID=36176 RepID=UPI001CB809E2|nr:transmembrane protein 144-like isoform X1 [Chiloscyllium plagiosum]XP_043551814.1 transmembrane protein 144-like isoform X1 [Chiloscyllium plagiosum]
MLFSLRWSLVSVFIGAVYIIGCDSRTNPNGFSNNRLLQNGTMEERFTYTKKAIPQNVTGTVPLVKGFVSTAVAVICFGSNFVPVKKIDTGDGLFFQWIFCTAVWVVSLVVHLIQQCPQFWPLTMLGGFLWATGNITVIPILKTVGLGMGGLIWATFSLLMGWASSRFGWFGLDVQKVPSPILNYIGTALAALSGCSLAMCAGLLYGSSFVPVLYIKNHAERNETEFFGASQFDMDYVFAYCSGIILTSTIYFLIYCAVKKNKPSVYSTAILPAFFSGLLWGIANSAWFLANYFLGAVITFPLVTAGPAVISLTWGVFYFKEIKGLQNFIILGVVLAVAVTGTILIGLSKIEGIA